MNRKCSYTKTCQRCVRHVAKMSLKGLPGERLHATYYYCSYHWQQTGLAVEA